MVKLLISLPKEEKTWLERYSRNKGQSVAQSIRNSIRLLRGAAERKAHYDAIQATAGIWKVREEGALEYQRRLRSDWDEPNAA